MSLGRKSFAETYGERASLKWSVMLPAYAARCRMHDAAAGSAAVVLRLLWS